MNFKDQMKADMAVFMNPDEFGEEILYCGKTIVAVEDGGGLGSSGSPGVITDLTVLFIKASDVSKPVHGDAVVFRSKNCNVTGGPQHDGGLWRIEIKPETKARVSV
jgi:hypothetical protein